ncbi:MAG: hypothetical protein FWE42_01195 [Defluviitaleaceae bacterium]|nr:hypothetical protein [Defluviitaleaceae bacterium]
MYGHRVFVGVVLAVLVLSFGACGNRYNGDNVSAAISRGILAPIEGYSAVYNFTPDFTAAEVTRGDIQRSHELVLSANFALVQPLTFQRGGGEYSGSLVGGAGTRVQAGDILAAQTFPPYILEPYQLNHNRLTFELESFEAQFTSGRRTRNEEIAAARANMQAAEPAHRPQLALQLRRLEIQLERFIHDSENTRNNLQEQLAEADILISQERIYAPFDGILINVSGALAGSSATPGHNYFFITQERHLFFYLTHDVDFIRYGKTYTITSSIPGLTFEATLINDPLAIGSWPARTEFFLAPGDWDGFASLLEYLEIEILDLVARGTALRLHVDETIAHDTLILPPRAVRTSQGNQYVLVYEGGRQLRRFVTTGIATQNQVQIIAGLEEGQQVILP